MLDIKKGGRSVEKRNAVETSQEEAVPAMYKGGGRIYSFISYEK